MTEEEIKGIVEQIVRLEEQADTHTRSENFPEASACINVAQKLETGLERRGYMLGDDGKDLLVYRAGPLRFVRSTWLIFDRTSRQWRYSSEREEK